MRHTTRGSHLHKGRPLGSVRCHRNGWPRGGARGAPVWEMGGKPVPAETVQDDHVMGFQINFSPYARRHLVVLDAYIQDSVWAALATGGDGGLHFGGQEEVS